MNSLNFIVLERRMGAWIEKVRAKWESMKKANPSTSWKQALIACKASGTNKPAPKAKKAAPDAHHNYDRSRAIESDSSSDDSVFEHF